MLDIHWTLTVHVPEVDALTQALLRVGDTLVASIDSIKAEVVRLGENQAAEAAALNEQVTKIADEVAQWNASGTPVTDVQMTNLETALRAAADSSAQHTASIQANTQAIQGIIPDEPQPA